MLVRHPEQGMAVRGTRFTSWPIHPLEEATFKIVYSFDVKEVVLRALYEAVPPSGR